MSLTIPKEQKQGVTTQPLRPVYQWVRLTPTLTYDEIAIKENDYSQEVTFEIAGDNCLNLSKSYFQFILNIWYSGKAKK